jgi:hypothetical protein
MFQGEPMTRRILLLGAMFVVFTCGDHAADPKEIESKVAELNVQSINILGVSLNALLFLVDASPYSFLLLSELERTGDVDYIHELEIKGYVKVETVQDLPNGTETNTKFMRVIPIGEGKEMQSCIVALKHNRQVERTR